MYTIKSLLPHPASVGNQTHIMLAKENEMQLEILYVKSILHHMLSQSRTDISITGL